MQKTRVRSLGRDNLLEKEIATHSSTLAWRIPWTEEPGGLVLGVPKKGMWVWDLAPWPEIKPGPPALGACSLSRWTTSEVPTLGDLHSYFYFPGPWAGKPLSLSKGLFPGL